MNSRVRFMGLLLLTATLSCAQSDAAEDEPPPNASRRAIRPAEDTSMLEPGELHAVSSARAEERTGPGDRPFDVALRTVPGRVGHNRRFGARTLEIALRAGTRELSQYPCTSCHMGRGMVLESERIADAHVNVQATHPRETGATCATCHAAENVGLLALQNGKRASLDHAYRICAQCHSPQVEAWSNGAHGKRLDGWQGRRVVMNCTDCHDPHAPAIRNRMPFRPPRLNRREK